MSRRSGEAHARLFSVNPVSCFLWVPGVLVAFALALAPSAHAQSGQNITKQVQSELNISLPSLSPLVQRVMPAVVNISAELTPQAAETLSNEDNGTNPEATPFDELLRRFFDQQGGGGFGFGQPHRAVMALGSGFIIDPHGYIATNNHVVAHAEKVTVIFQDNSRHPAKVIGRDPLTDLALLKIDTSKPLPYLQWGNSDAAKVGDWVVAVGNPFGLGGTVTAGIISALGRDLGATNYEDFLQIDAPINRGNSGGPTFNLSGQVIGINTAIYTPSGGSVGIGFAIPSDVAKSVLDQIRTTGKVEHGWLGVSIQNVTPGIAKGLGLGSNVSGALIAGVESNSPAAEAGLKQGDIITAANGEPVRAAHDLQRIVRETAIGKPLPLTIERGGKEEKLTATIANLPANPQMAAAGSPQGNAANGNAAGQAVGLTLGALTPGVRARLHVPRDQNGVVVQSVAQDSPAAALGIQPGDVILSVDQQPVSSPADAAQKLRQAANSGDILLLVNHDGTPEFLAMSVENGQKRG